MVKLKSTGGNLWFEDKNKKLAMVSNQYTDFIGIYIEDDTEIKIEIPKSVMIFIADWIKENAKQLD